MLFIFFIRKMAKTKRKLQKTFFNITFAFKRKFLFISYTRRIKLQYSEATISESLDFLEILEADGQWLLEYLVDFLEETTQGKYWEKFFYKNIIPELGKFIDILRDTKYRAVFQVKKGNEVNKAKKQLENMSSWIAEIEEQVWKMAVFLSMHTSMDFISILNKYTFSQISFAIGKVIYYKNEKTEEGRKENERIDNKKYFSKHKKSIDSQIARIDLFYKNQKKWVAKKI